MVARDGGLELRGIRLHVSGVRGAPHPDLAVHVGKLREVLDGVEAVLPFADVLREDTLGSVGPADVLESDDVSVRREVPRGFDEARAGLPVRSSLEEDRKLLVEGSATASRAIDVRRQANAVPHRDHQVLFEAHDLERDRDREAPPASQRILAASRARRQPVPALGT